MRSRGGARCAVSRPNLFGECRRDRHSENMGAGKPRDKSDRPPFSGREEYKCMMPLVLPRTWVHSLSKLSGTIYLVCVSLRRQAAEGHMGSFVVVVGPPFFDALPGIGHRDKPGSV